MSERSSVVDILSLRPSRWHQCVQLRHELSDGSRHIDWMIDSGGSGERPLVTFRLSDELHNLAGKGEMPIERIGDHRRLYLTFEGELSAARGRVEHIATGDVRLRGEEPGFLRLETRWSRRADLWIRLHRDQSGSWWVSAGKTPGNPAQ